MLKRFQNTSLTLCHCVLWVFVATSAFNGMCLHVDRSFFTVEAHS